MNTPWAIFFSNKRDFNAKPLTFSLCFFRRFGDPITNSQVAYWVFIIFSFNDSRYRILNSSLLLVTIILFTNTGFFTPNSSQKCSISIQLSLHSIANHKTHTYEDPQKYLKKYWPILCEPIT